MATHAWTRSTEFDFDTGGRREVPLTPRHTASFNVMWEGEAWGRVGVEAYYTGRQALDDNPYRDHEPPLRAVRRPVRAPGRPRALLRQRREPRRRPPDEVRPADPSDRLPDGRWTVDAWAPLDGRVWNGGVRLSL